MLVLQFGNLLVLCCLLHYSVDQSGVAGHLIEFLFEFLLEAGVVVHQRFERMKGPNDLQKRKDLLINDVGLVLEQQVLRVA